MPLLVKAHSSSPRCPAGLGRATMTTYSGLSWINNDRTENLSSTGCFCPPPWACLTGGKELISYQITLHSLVCVKRPLGTRYIEETTRKKRLLENLTSRKRRDISSRIANVCHNKPLSFRAFRQSVKAEEETAIYW